MQRVYLNGGISQFGDYWETQCKTIRDIFKLIECQTPGFRKYIIDAAENGVGFEIRRGSEILSEEPELLLSLNDEDIVITEVPSGSKSGGAKILAALAIAALFFIPGSPLALQAAGTTVTGTTAGTGTLAGVQLGGVQAAGYAALTTPQLIAASVAVNLALTGISQIMMPGPEVDAGTDESYLFDGPTNSITQGLPVPVAYGELVVGGAPISQYYQPSGKQGGVFSGSGYVTDGSSALANLYIPGLSFVNNYGLDGKTDEDEYGR